MCSIYDPCFKWRQTIAELDFGVITTPAGYIYIFTYIQTMKICEYVVYVCACLDVHPVQGTDIETHSHILKGAGKIEITYIQ